MHPTFTLHTTPFDEDYTPSADTRTTTNFANLARGENRRQNLRNTITMIDNRFNDLVRWDNLGGDRYALDLDIVSVDLQLREAFPIIEVLNVSIRDRVTGAVTPGIVGNNFSSYIRDYDFSVKLPNGLPDDFGVLHGRVFERFLESDAYRSRFEQDPVICISVSTSRTYERTTNEHPVLGVEYAQPEGSLTDLYFGKMGLSVRYFMPPGSVAPLAFYHRGDLLNDYTPLQLAGTIATMETFQKIYRPEIYNANSAAPAVYRPSLEHSDFSVPKVDYDRDERARLGKEQGAYTEEHLMKPYGAILEEWTNR